MHLNPISFDRFLNLNNKAPKFVIQSWYRNGRLDGSNFKMALTKDNRLYLQKFFFRYKHYILNILIESKIHKVATLAFHYEAEKL